MKKVLFVYVMVVISGLPFSSDTSAESKSGSESGKVCNNEYVLCTSAPCIPDPSSPDSKAICSCEVNRGPNFGMSDCEARKPSTDSNGVKKALSTYSFAQAPAKPVLSCPEGKPWTDCLDQPCIVDPINPLKAICTCRIVRDRPFVTYGGECNTFTCDNAYWSAATLASFMEGSSMLAEAMGLESIPAAFCPGMKP
ncbi:MAG: hypothetical protein RIG61_06205 [Deltaproteobacteria bacterium]